MSKLNFAPRYYEGPHSRLGRLIRQEAMSQHLMVTALAEAEPELGIGAPQLEDVGHGIKAAIVAGWARVLDDFSGLVHLNPAVMDPETGYAVFEPWSEELFRVRIGIEVSLQAAASVYTGRAADIREAKQTDYTGQKRKRPVIVITGTDEGPVH
jgi:hypothetical protein